MNNTVLVKSYNDLPVDRGEILRYAGCKEETADLAKLVDECLGEVQGHLKYSVCYRLLPLDVAEDVCNLGILNVRSRNLAENLKDCDNIIVFAATVGVEMDRLIAKYSRISPAKAVIMQAIGAERIETLCNTFCKDIAKDEGFIARPRFSPGYGDLPLAAQRDIFLILNCSKWIGLSLNDSLLMSPTKSVTAFMGVSK